MPTEQELLRAAALGQLRRSPLGSWQDRRLQGSGEAQPAAEQVEALVDGGLLRVREDRSWYAVGEGGSKLLGARAELTAAGREALQPEEPE